MNIGDRVEVIRYGSLMWSTEPMSFKLLGKDDTLFIYDWRPELVGRVGTITEKIESQGRNQYSVNLDEGGKLAWYNESQLKKLST